MNLNLTPAQASFRNKVRSLVAEQVIPHASAWDEKATFPAGAVARMAAEGLLGMLVPTRYGGLGLDPISLALAIEEIARGDGSLALTLASHNTLACGHLLLCGSDEQRERWLPVLASGQCLGAWALTEVESGSDASAMKTVATATDGGWLLQGHKFFVTQGRVAGLYIILAKTVAGDGKTGISAFLVEKGTPGLRPGRPLRKMGCRSSDTSALELKQVRVPSDHLLGVVNHGFRDALKLLETGRVAIAAMAVGIARAALEAAVAHAGKREQFGRPIGSLQAIQWQLADMATEVDAARLLVYRAAQRLVDGLPCTRESAMAKLFAAEAATRVANRALQIHGGYGYLRTVPVERYLRDAKLCEIGEGTSEIQRLVIARSLLKDGVDDF